MQVSNIKDTEALSNKPKMITVTVNERPVNFSQHKVTGLEIKQTAIKQGVAIQEDFVLFEVKGNSPLKQIGDCETITLHEGQKFRATAPDDNS
ncbi:multiubiquitin domain-containing protein [Nostoc sp.]|uniref:multiubiquitin domain-containing protein n=1 Tax=Nostoc sp. TaxID=1180 RepID=UPI0035936587